MGQNARAYRQLDRTAPAADDDQLQRKPNFHWVFLSSYARHVNRERIEVKCGRW